MMTCSHQMGKRKTHQSRREKKNNASSCPHPLNLLLVVVVCTDGNTAAEKATHALRSRTVTTNVERGSSRGERPMVLASIDHASNGENSQDDFKDSELHCHKGVV